MKGKYITPQLRLACLSQQTAGKKDVHAELQEIVNERKKIVQAMQEQVRKAELISLYINVHHAA